MILSWGKCKIEHANSKDGAPEELWTAIDTPEINTTKLTPTAGDKNIAQEEGGDIVDIRYGKTTYVFEFTLYVKKGKARPFEDEDGQIAGEHSLRVSPLEDTSCEGIQIDRCVIRCEESYATDKGKLLHYVADCLKPKTGKTVKPYTVS